MRLFSSLIPLLLLSCSDGFQTDNDEKPITDDTGVTDTNDDDTGLEETGLEPSEPSADPLDVDDDGDGFTENEGDCDDLDPEVFPGADDIPEDEIDQDCDGVDSMYLDEDGDGYNTAEDCDDTNPDINPDATDIPGDEIDQDCDGVDAEIEDADGDGYDNTIDCDDSDPALNLDDLDGDGDSSCSGDCDDSDPALNATDADGDGSTICDNDCDDSDPSLSTIDADGDGASSCEGDCDDTDPALNLLDADMDAFPTCPLDYCYTVSLTDTYGDGWNGGSLSMTQDGSEVALLELPTGSDAMEVVCMDGGSTMAAVFTGGMYVNEVGYEIMDVNGALLHSESAPSDGENYTETVPLLYDCDDTDPLINPDAADVPGDGLDQDCNGVDAPVIVDNDGDGSEEGVDCNDSDPTIYPGATEIPNDGIDQDCDGADLLPDDDGDGYDVAQDCDDTDASLNWDDSDADGYSSCDDDCDDSDASLNLDDLDADGYSSCDGDCDDSDATLNLDDADFDGYTSCDGDCDDFDASLNWDDADADGFITCPLNPCYTFELYDSYGDGWNGGSLSVQSDSVEVALLELPTGSSDTQVVCVDPGVTMSAVFSAGSFVSEVSYEIYDAGGNLLHTEDPPEDGDTYSILASGSAADCDDSDSSVYPGATEIANDGIDQDCDGSDSTVVVDGDADGFDSSVDCNDNDASVYPGAVEIPNDGIDQDCDGVDAIAAIDADADGYDSSVDCNDSDASINPGAIEIPNDGIDQDCDGMDDTATDADGDGYYSEDDCDDSDADLNWDDSDNDGYATCPTACYTLLMEDSFGDGWNGASLTVTVDGLGFETYTLTTGATGTEIVCMPDGAQYELEFSSGLWDTEITYAWTDSAGLELDYQFQPTAGVSYSGVADGLPDCDDGDAGVNPSAAEIENDGIDQDCDGTDLVVLVDNDGDGDDASVDCDDSDPSLNLFDYDNDGYSTCDGDCDDYSFFVYPGAQELVNDGVDQDCNGVDAVGSCDNSCAYANDGVCDDGGPYADYDVCDFGSDCADCGIRYDADADGFYDDEGTTPLDSTMIMDCDDTDATIYPGANELVNDGIDQDCNGSDAVLACDDSCTFAGDGVCDDGGSGSAYDVCALGTDCSDCGVRYDLDGDGVDSDADCDDDEASVGASMDIDSQEPFDYSNAIYMGILDNGGDTVTGSSYIYSDSDEDAFSLYLEDNPDFLGDSDDFDCTITAPAGVDIYIDVYYEGSLINSVNSAGAGGTEYYGFGATWLSDDEGYYTLKVTSVGGYSCTEPYSITCTKP